MTENVALETYEDGTSVLNIPHAVLDDCGEYTCEALNRNGVDTTVTTVVVLQGMLIHYALNKVIKKPTQVILHFLIKIELVFRPWDKF